MCRAGLLAALLLAACTTNEAGAEPSRAAARYQAIAFEINSWGRPIDSWEIRVDGSGHYVEMKSENGAPFGTYRLEHRDFAVGTEGFARIAAIAAALPLPRPSIAACEQRATDFPYGTLHLDGTEASETMTFDTGCRDAPYLDLFIAPLREMDSQVTAWAHEQLIVRGEHIGGP